MNQKAFSVGDLAARALAGGRDGWVTRVFQRSAYVRSGDDFVLLLWGELRSPMTINIEGGGRAHPRIRSGERCLLSPDAAELESVRIDLKEAKRFQSPLLPRRSLRIPATPALVKGVTALRALYEVSPGPTLVTDSAFDSFVDGILTRFASGDQGVVHAPESYGPLLGRGGGFTPAGDDFVGGLLAVVNFVARCRRARQVLLPMPFLLARTIPESAALLSYSARGQVDEVTGRLVLKTLDGSDRFFDELMAVAHRGHTSGIDMSMGVLLGEAAMAQAGSKGGALKACLDALRKP